MLRGRQLAGVACGVEGTDVARFASMDLMSVAEHGNITLSIGRRAFDSLGPLAVLNAWLDRCGELGCTA